MANKTRLELTWPGKENRPRLEPRILIEDPELSYHAEHRAGESDIFDNRLIHGDNLLALKALEQEFAGRVNSVYIDPPFNTGEAMANYDDGQEHSIWLSLMQARCQAIHRLLAPTGTMFVHIDDNEFAYLTVLLDEIFGRENRIAVITFKQASATGHKSINPGVVSVTNFLIVYAKRKAEWRVNRVYTSRERDERYGQFIENRNAPHSEWCITTLSQAFAASCQMKEKDVRRLPDYRERINRFVIDNAKSVIQFAKPDYDAVSSAAREMIDKSLHERDKVYHLERSGYSDIYLRNGKRILFYESKLKEIDGEKVSGEPLTSLWDDILSNNIHNEGAVEFPKGKKPEGLIKRALELSTVPGDIVLDSFLGSGTTAAVAHKMGRRWIGIELGEHAITHCVPRLKQVIDGTDQGGISKAVGWKGGGGFRFYRLAPSLLQQDKWGNWIISKEYDAGMLAEAMCKHEGFTYSPSESVYWQQGHSTETDFIYTTTQTLTHEQLAHLSEEVGEGRSLLVCCSAFRANPDAFDNLTVRKIPNAVLSRCEFGHDDYSLEVANLPTAPPETAASTGRNGKHGAANGTLAMDFDDNAPEAAP